MSYLESLKHRKAAIPVTDKGDKSPSVGFVGGTGGQFLECARHSTPDLLGLIERVAALYRTPPDEVAEMKRLALRDPGAAWRCFLVTARTEGIQ